MAALRGLAWLGGAVVGAGAGAVAHASDGSAPPQAAAQELPEVTVIGTSPVPGTGIPIELYPGNAQSISSRSIASGTASAAAALDASIGSVNLNDTQGNAFQTDLDYRGFTASPVLGTPQGLSVYVDGIRANEPFGDIVSWDLIPQIAIANITVIPGANPVYGLNTLGGAIAIHTKSGFAYPGTEVALSGGSFARRTVEAQTGGSSGAIDYYLAGSTFDERGWTHFNPSRVRQAFGKVGFQDARTDVDLSLQLVEDLLGGNQLVAYPDLGNAAQGYSHPDSTATRSLVLNLTGRREAASGGSLEGGIYLRRIARVILNSNVIDPVVPGSANQAATCLANFAQYCAGNVRSAYDQDVYGLSLQASRVIESATGRWYASAGAATDRGATGFTQAGQDAVVDAGHAVLGIDGYAPQSGIVAHSRSAGVYATATWAAGPASLTASLRADHSSIALSGHSIDGSGAAVDVGGEHGYGRANPALGGTYALAPSATAFFNLAQGLRTPSAIELACADAAHPCAGVPNAFSSDPGLQAIVARGAELGARGRLEAAHAALVWRAAAFYTRLDNDILFNQSTLNTGYYSNVGRTQRAGFESSVDVQSGPANVALTLTRLQATYRSSFEVADGANPGAACPGAACVPARPGDRIPGIPPWIGKLRVALQATASSRIEMQWQAQGPSYARGDENNLPSVGFEPARVPGYATARAGATWISGPLELYATVSNLFNRRYANFGMLAANNLEGGVAQNFWAVGAPRAAVLGLRWTVR